MKTVESFNIQKSKIVESLNKLLAFLEDAQLFDVDVDSALVHKIKAAISLTSDQKLKVALVGGFSEGKTSIAAAWTEKFDSSQMNISQSESTDDVQVYEMENLELIDTPGLFGYKKTNDNEKYKDITKKLVSDVNLILYVMNPNNPVKESHRTELSWLFNDIDLLSRTVFVIGRFDEEVDIEDEEDYALGLKIKQANIEQRLIDFGILEKGQKVPIVAVSANPFEKGIPYWLKHMDIYNRISHIQDLQDATTKLIESSGGKDSLVVSTMSSLVKDVLQREIPIAEQRMNQFEKELNKLYSTYNEIKVQLARTDDKINQSETNLEEFIIRFYTDLIRQVKGTGQDTIEDFFEKI